MADQQREYVRTNGGQMVHKPGCRYDANGIPWKWASGREIPAIRHRAAVYGIKLRWCRRCFPEVNR